METNFDRPLEQKLNSLLNVQDVTVTINSEWGTGLYYGQTSLPVSPSKVLAVSPVSATNFRGVYAGVIGNDSAGYFIRAFCTSNSTTAVIRVLYTA